MSIRLVRNYKHLGKNFCSELCKDLRMISEKTEKIAEKFNFPALFNASFQCCSCLKIDVTCGQFEFRFGNNLKMHDMDFQ